MAAGTITRLQALAGVWHGSGVSHDGEPFLALLEIRGALAGRGVRCSFEARAEDKGLLHGEELLCFPGEPPGTTAAVYVSTDGPAFMLTEADAPDGVACFAVGDPTATAVFRLRWLLATDEDGDLALAWAWGLPGGEFADRSRATLTRD